MCVSNVSFCMYVSLSFFLSVCLYVCLFNCQDFCLSIVTWEKEKNSLDFCQFFCRLKDMILFLLCIPSRLRQLSNIRLFVSIILIPKGFYLFVRDKFNVNWLGPGLEILIILFKEGTEFDFAIFFWTMIVSRSIL